MKRDWLRCSRDRNDARYPFTTLNKCNRAIRYDGAWGLLLVVATAVGWGLGWPMMKIAMRDWPPLFARGCAGLAAALGLARLKATSLGLLDRAA